MIIDDDDEEEDGKMSKMGKIAGTVGASINAIIIKDPIRNLQALENLSQNVSVAVR